MIADSALIEAALEECDDVKAATTRALSLQRPRNAVSVSAMALAMCGDATPAEALIDDLTRRLPGDTLVNNLLAPSVRAFIEIHRGNPAQAIQMLEVARKYEGGALAAGFCTRAGLLTCG